LIDHLKFNLHNNLFSLFLLMQEEGTLKGSQGINSNNQIYYHNILMCKVIILNLKGS
jgi:hypothetical protein